MHLTTIRLTAAALAVACTSVVDADPAYYQRKSTWQETLTASRQALETELANPAAQNQAQAPRLGAWYQIGPFKAADSFNEVFPPEQEIDFSKPCGNQRWQQITVNDGVVHGQNCPDNAAIYFAREIIASTPTVLAGFFGSDDGLAVWLNGKKLISQHVARGVSPNQDRSPLELQAGRNLLLLKVWNRSGGFGWYFSTAEKPGSIADPATLMRNSLWDLVSRDFTDPAARRQIAWEHADNIWALDWAKATPAALARRYVDAADGTRLQANVSDCAAKVKTVADLAPVREAYYKAKAVQETLAQIKGLDLRPLRRAIEDLTRTFPDKYPAKYLQQLDTFEQALTNSAPGALEEVAGKLLTFRDAALLANPLMNFDRLLFIKRKGHLGLPQNWQGNCALPRSGYDNEIDVLDMHAPAAPPKTLFRPEGQRFVGDVDLHFDADRMLISSTAENGRWRIFELSADGKNLRQITTGDYNDVDNYDACYLPDDRIIFGSTRCFQGVPCVGGGNQVANLFICNPDGTGVRRLTFDQDHDWCPTVLNNGRVMYTRWEYSDTPHYFTRILMHMNPDGTQQSELYGSNSYWPNSIFYARPIPGDPNKIIAVISGHHGVPRMGELILFDPSRGRHEADGVIQRIPGYGQPVEPIIRDQLVNSSWPRFLHPYPLSDKYFLVSCQMTANDNWDLYLVDVFDNMLQLHHDPGFALFEPVPFRKTTRPPVIPDRVDTNRKDAVVYLKDVYFGKGLTGIPHGTVKKLRLYEDHFAYYRMGGHIDIGIDGPWDVHRILGTVPVQADGSAMFRVPANTPIAVQPLDAEGKALQVMRSWFTAMPGEILSCVGCHENQNSVPPSTGALAAQNKPDDITPWYGPARGFSFTREVQPVLDKYCVSCHNGTPAANGKTIPDLRRSDKKGERGFTPSYLALHPYVRRPGPESDYHLLPPADYYADTSELVQMLRKGHGRVTLDAEAWDRLVTWIDLNVPDHGTWTEYRRIAGDIHERRLEMMKLYAGINEDPEQLPAASDTAVTPVTPAPPPAKPDALVTAEGWPFDAAEAKRRQEAAGAKTTMSVALGDGIELKLVLIPAGEFVMGDIDGCRDEWPLTRTRIAKPFWMGELEISNDQYARFDPAHDSRYISVFNKDQSTRGEPANRGSQPVIRVSWQQAMAFCTWLSAKTGLTFSLPTEAQWEYACRAGTATPLDYGSVDADFAKFANLADQRLNALTRRDSPNWIPCIDSVNDGATITVDGGHYSANAWGLRDMHGNVSEWTRTTYAPYPYDPHDGRDNGSASGRKVVRGGSFYDRPKRARSAFRLDYHPWEGVFNVGFRVVCDADVNRQANAAPTAADAPSTSVASR